LPVRPEPDGDGHRLGRRAWRGVARRPRPGTRNTTLAPSRSASTRRSTRSRV